VEGVHWEEQDLLLRIRVQPRAARDEFVVQGGQLKARITAPPLDGRANDHLLAFLACAFGVPRNRVSLLSGQSSRIKRLRIAAPARLPPALQPTTQGD
jgi:uncharacterized protein